jgi:segregation and condensation protein A
MELLLTRIAEAGSVGFIDLLARCRERSEMVATFIALLELIKLGRARITQEEPFGEITVTAGLEPEEES